MGTADDFTKFPPFFSVLHCPLGLGELTVPCKMVLATPNERGTCPYHVSLRLFTMVRSCCFLCVWSLPAGPWQQAQDVVTYSAKTSLPHEVTRIFLYYFSSLDDVTMMMVTIILTEETTIRSRDLSARRSAQKRWVLLGFQLVTVYERYLVL